MTLTPQQLLIDAELQQLRRRIERLEAQLVPTLQDLYAGAALKALIQNKTDMPHVALAREAWAIASAMTFVAKERQL